MREMSARVSVVIPTYNRAADVRIAVGCALGQTYPAEALEIIVVDDGGIDDTGHMLRRDFGDRIRYVRTENRGVSAARNHGLGLATGAYLALLDDDDEWLPAKIAVQARVLDERPEIGMVLTDVERTDDARRTVDVFRRREQFPVDGNVIAHAVRRPSFVPSSSMFRRAVLDATGGFDATLPTAEDIDFLLRVALRFGIAVVSEPLTRAMHDHQGLSELPRSYRDYVTAVERFVRVHRDDLAPADRDAALFAAYLKNLRGYLWTGDFTGAARIAAAAARHARTPADRRQLAGLGASMAKKTWSRLVTTIAPSGRRSRASRR
ncbi:MAG TPA: glycosyltransferase family A protein [Kofleriaceae bacterium]|nr:glycosyltransferase family A protein [Kofleriaceae bacterium]